MIRTFNLNQGEELSTARDIESLEMVFPERGLTKDALETVCQAMEAVLAGNEYATTDQQELVAFVAADVSTKTYFEANLALDFDSKIFSATLLNDPLRPWVASSQNFRPLSDLTLNCLTVIL